MIKPAEDVKTNWRWRLVLMIAGWGVLLTWPFVFADKDNGISWIRYFHYLLGMVIFVAIYYANYYYFINRFLIRKQILFYALANLLFSLTLLMLVYLLGSLLPASEDIAMLKKMPAPPPFSLFRFICSSLVVCAFVCAISVSARMTSRWYAAEDERKELERSRSEAELQNLKSQLNPHFLFNTLNNIYSMISFSPEGAQSAVHELSRLLRYVLYESSAARVSVEQEFDFVRNYVELMRIRLPKQVELRTAINCSSPHLSVAPLLFIALVENAFKHGVSSDRQSFIHLEISADDAWAKCEIINSLFPKDDGDKSGSGIGIANLRKRLDLLYGEKYVFSFGADGCTWRCLLRIPLSERAEP
ncbi:MAG: sensor histidine kinase [Tannerellaceae bacterium]|jgi:sensor histidine kinase YesM|nr:sensor histidine kinase [Tannerellaceae bacterium]